MFLANSEVKTLALPSTATARTLKSAVLTKLDIPTTPPTSDMFELFIASPAKMVVLSPDTPIAGVLENIEAVPEASRPWIQLSLLWFAIPTLLQLEDNATRHLVFVEAVSRLAASDYMPDSEQIAALGGLHCQALFGDFDPVRHSKGFLVTRHLEEYVPSLAMPDKSADDWEELILTAWSAQSVQGLDTPTAEARFLEVVASVPFFGTMWIRPCFSSTFDRRVRMGVSPDGLVVVDPETHARLAIFPHRKLRRWVGDAAKFIVEVRVSPSLVVHEFTTDQAGFVNVCLKRCVMQLFADVVNANASSSTSSPAPTPPASTTQPDNPDGSAPPPDSNNARLDNDASQDKEAAPTIAEKRSKTRNASGSPKKSARKKTARRIKSQPAKRIKKDAAEPDDGDAPGQDLNESTVSSPSKRKKSGIRKKPRSKSVDLSKAPPSGDEDAPSSPTKKGVKKKGVKKKGVKKKGVKKKGVKKKGVKKKAPKPE